MEDSTDGGYTCSRRKRHPNPAFGDEWRAPGLAQFKLSLIHSRIVFSKAVFGEDPPTIGNPDGKKSRNWGKRKLNTVSSHLYLAHIESLETAIFAPSWFRTRIGPL